MAWMPFEWKLEGLIWNDPKISLFVRLKTLVVAAFFWILYFLLLKKEYLARRDSRQNHHGRWRAACFSILKYLEGNALHPTITSI
jgi:hypothetical protein